MSSGVSTRSKSKRSEHSGYWYRRYRLYRYHFKYWRASKGGKKQGFQKAGSVEHNEILNQTIAPASTLSLHRDTAFTQAIKAAYTHMAICKLVFVDGYDSLYHFKDIKSVELFSKYLPHCFHMEKTQKLSDDKMPFDLRNSSGSTDYIAIPKNNPDSYFPTLQDIEIVCLLKH